MVVAMKKARFYAVSTLILLLGIVLACGGEATPAPAPEIDTAAIQQAVEQALAARGAQSTGPSAEEIAQQMQAAVQAAIPEGGTSSAEEIAQQIEAAVQAAMPEDTSAEEITRMVQQAISSLPTPAAMPVPATPAPAKAGPSGSLNVGLSILFGAAEFNLTSQGITQSRFDNVFTHHDMWVSSPEGDIQGNLVREWEVDPTGTTYTFYLQEGAMFSGDWGEFTADDLIFSLEQVSSAESVHSVKGATRATYTCEECDLTKIDDYTVQLTRPGPTVQITWNNQAGFNIQSKQHFDGVGKERANRESVGTGSWELVDYSIDEFRQLKARRDHWRKTPNFDELTVWELQEESTRLANFLTGIIDTGSFTADTVDTIRSEADSTIEFMRLPGGEYLHFIFYGMQHHLDYPDHVPDAEGKVAVALADSAGDCDLPWVSCDRDLDSDEWQKALNVRQALAIGIDRNKLVNALAGGDGEPLHLLHWTGHEGLARELGLDSLEYEYDPAKARQLLAQAGYPNGIDFDMTLTEFANAGPIAAGEAVATMWQEIGARAKLNRVPYSAWRPCTIDRSCKAIATHNNAAWVEPMRIFPNFYHPRNAFNLGFEHPFMTDLLDRMLATPDWEMRKQLTAELGRFTFDQVVGIPLYTRKVVWPLGEKLDQWGVQARQTEFLSNWEFAPHGT